MDMEDKLNPHNIKNKSNRSHPVCAKNLKSTATPTIQKKNNQDRTQQTLIHSMTIDLKKSKDRISSLETKLNAAETVKASMERELSTANQTLDKNIHQRDVLLRDLDHSKEDIAANKRNTKTENQRLNKQVKELREEVRSTSQELTAERARVSERRSEIREVTQKMEAVSRAS